MDRRALASADDMLESAGIFLVCLSYADSNQMKSLLEASLKLMFQAAVNLADTGDNLEAGGFQADGEGFWESFGVRDSRSLMIASRVRELEDCLESSQFVAAALKSEAVRVFSLLAGLSGLSESLILSYENH